MSFNITPVASGYQEIHPYSAMNIDSVKINTSLIMVKECKMSILRITCLDRTTGKESFIFCPGFENILIFYPESPDMFWKYIQ